MRGYAKNKDSHLNRLHSIENQIRDLHRLIEDDAYCIDVLDRIADATAALRAVSLGLLEDHVGHCVTQAVLDAGSAADEKVTDASKAIARLVRS
ncbi:metal-sensitive transcriptional regulator [Umezawaea sp. NPDC059074]|uniref:metal-sensitive transcriptional regulator n=1 Tax=Umezawaea sp. NPDC059074 TaxID=3346716 RepID=UPI0036C341F8